VMLNWELELKTWCPGLRVMTYFGSPQGIVVVFDL